MGGAIASSQNGYDPDQPIYFEPRPVYVEEDLPHCHLERQGYIDAYCDEHIRRVRVCK